MKQRQRDRSLGDGVYYNADDYIGLGPRILILILDTLVLIAIVWLIAFTWVNIVGDYNWIFAGIIALAIWLYVVPLKQSTFRTIGYRMSSGSRSCR